MPETPLFRYADHLLRRHGGVRAFVANRRDRGRSWRLIARELYVATKGEIDLTDQTLRKWFAEEDDNGDEAVA